ncbi:MAG: hypothetical protein GXO54_02360 [Chloroflexi bacterium]|nr:hypothetical protein [Chloroflexota bacterium]
MGTREPLQPPVRVLWMEDKAGHELAMVASAVYLDGRFALDFATDASEALHLLALTDQERYPYQILVVDLDLPPGEQQDLIEVYQEVHHQGRTPMLGLYLLEYLLAGEGPLHQRVLQKPDSPLSWALNLLRKNIRNQTPPPRIGVFSIYAEMTKDRLRQLGLEDDVIIQKRVGMPRYELLNLLIRLAGWNEDDALIEDLW